MSLMAATRSQTKKVPYILSSLIVLEAAVVAVSGHLTSEVVGGCSGHFIRLGYTYNCPAEFFTHPGARPVFDVSTLFLIVTIIALVANLLVRAYKSKTR